jgi:hypothetical protein
VDRQDLAHVPATSHGRARPALGQKPASRPRPRSPAAR